MVRGQIVEADGREELSRGLQGMFVRMARRMNKVLGRRGAFFRDRFHEHVLRKPREVWNALRYVLSNQRKHGHLTGRSSRPDDMSSGVGFEGWADWKPDDETGLPQAETWLLRVGWQRIWGPIPLESSAAGWAGG